MSKKNKIGYKIQYIKKIDAVILGIVFIMFIVLIGGVWISTENNKEQQLLLIQDTMDILSDNQKTQFENYISEKVERLQGFATFREINGMDHQVQSKFLKDRSDELGFHHIFIMDKNGKSFYIDEGITRSQKNEPFYQNVMNNDIYITEPFYGEYEAYMTVCVSMFDYSGEKIGALCGAVELNTVRDIFVETRTVVNGDMFLINRDGVYVAANDMQQVYNKKSIYDAVDSDYSLVETTFEKKTDQTGVIIQNGKEYQADITYLEDYDWAIVQCIATEEIFKNLEEIEMWRYLLDVIVAIIIMCVGRIAIYWRRSLKGINTDTLTGCQSRASMESLIAKLEHNRKNQVTICYMDLNKFKSMNDTYGHDMGDKVLCIFSKVLMEVFNKKGYVGRMGGDEFMVILLNTKEEEVLELCHEIEKLLKIRSEKLEFEYSISTSYGYATRLKGEKESLQNIINKADENMYRFKEEHRQQ